MKRSFLIPIFLVLFVSYRSYSQGVLSYSKSPDIENAVFTTNQFDFTPQEGGPRSVAFNNDGTRLYTVGPVTDTVYTYNLSTPYDISTASYMPLSLSTINELTSPRGLTFNTSGTKMFLIGTASNVIAYDLTIPFDPSSGTYNGEIFSVNSQEASPEEIVFDNTGSKLFLIGLTDSVYTYNLATNFDVSTAIYSGNSLNIGLQEGTPTGIAFNKDGSAMYIVGHVSDSVFRYDLSTPFELTSASYNNESFYVGNEISTSDAVVYNNSGSKMFVLGSTTNNVFEYDLTSSAFFENPSNDGSVSGDLIVNITGDTFVGTLTESLDYTVDNLPSGLLPSMIPATNGSSASLTLSGNALNNDDIDDISDLQFTFNNSAFIGGNAGVIANSQAASSNLGVDFLAGSTLQTVSTSDSLALVALYDSTNGAGWTDNTNWLTGPVDTWFGVTVNGGRVTKIDLVSNNMTGTLPPAIGDLSQMDTLNIYINAVSGTIPFEFYNLSNLREAELGINQFSDTLSSGIQNMTELRRVSFFANSLSGTIPPEIGNLSNLNVLELANNSFTGTLPSELGNLSNLSYLRVENNDLTGPIPTELGNIPFLFDLYLAGNSFSGRLPAELLSTTVSFISLENNLLDSLPDFSGNSFTQFSISNNYFTFEDLEPNQSIITSNTGQLPYGVPQNLSVTRNDPVILDASIPGQGVNDSYQWQKDGVDIGGATSLQYSIGSAQLADAGTYELKVNNSLVTGIEIVSEPITLNVTTPLVSTTDSLALVALYNSTNGASWTDNTNWLSGNVSTWFGVTVTADRVTQINLFNNNLSGNIPDEVGDLVQLQILDLGSASAGNITGPIPTTIGNLVNLTELDLGNQPLSGVIPTEIGNCVSLTRIDFGYCCGTGGLNGSLPESLGNLSSIDVISIRNHQLSGAIPDSIFSSSVRVLQLSGHNLSGSIPASIIDAPNLQSLSLGSNSLSGSIPLGISNLALTSLSISGNSFTGQIPAEIGSISTLTSIFISDNQFSGELPVELSQLTNLTSLSVSNNSFSGAIPVDFLNLTSLDNFWFTGTNLCEPSDAGYETWKQSVSNFQSNGISCDALLLESDSLVLVALYNSTDGPNWTNNSNWLIGPVDTWYGVTVMAGRVTELQLGDENSGSDGQFNEGNNLVGTIPIEIGNLDGLTSLSLTDNLLTGVIPDTIGSLTNLVSLALGSIGGGRNQFTGGIPTSFGNLINLEDLFLATANLSGAIPAELGNLTNLRNLTLFVNNLEGPIPTELGNLNNLFFLRLQANNLSGEIPETVGNISSLRYLELDNNNFDSLPDLSARTDLVSFRVSGNKFTFEDLEPNQSVITDNTGQDNFGLPQTIQITNGDTVTLNSNIPGVGVNDLYQWRKDGIDIPGANDTTYTILNFDLSKSGQYQLAVTNSAVSGIEIISEIIQVQTLDPYNLETDSLALVALYNSTDGANWTNNTNWLTGPVDTWYGVTVGGGRVTEIFILDNGLSGNLPTEISDLTALDRLLINSEDSLSGPIPSEIGNLSSLTELSLTGCNFTGEIPITIGDLSSLTSLSLTANSLSGEIPSQIGNLTNLSSLTLNANSLTGSIPTTIGNLINLRTLYLDNNELTGEIPLEIENLVNLVRLSFSRNNFTGTIPSGIGGFSDLIWLYFSNNQLIGPIPTSFTSLNLEEFSCDNNEFTNLPDFSTLTNVSFFTVNNNRFSFADLEPNLPLITSSLEQKDFGPPQNFIMNVGDDLTLNSFIPSVSPNDTYQWQRNDVDIIGANDTSLTLTNISSLDAGIYKLVVTNSSFPNLTIESQPITVSVFDPVLETDSLALVDFYLQGNGPEWTNNQNWLTGPVNSWYGVTVENGRVVGLDFSGINDIGNNVALVSNPSLSALTAIRTIDFTGNDVAFEIPPEIFSLTSLEELTLTNAGFLQEIPSNIDTLSNLRRLILRNLGIENLNNFSLLTNLDSLIELDLSGSGFNGTEEVRLPASVGDFPVLQILYMNYSSLSGPIPPEIGSLTTLRELLLDHNNLTGELPATIGNLTQLEVLNFWVNELTGSIPSEIGELSKLNYLDLSLNQLSGAIPPELFQSGSLVDLDLSYNRLTGSLPSSISQSPNLFRLILNDNLLSGPLPVEIGGLSNLDRIFAANNSIESIPDDLSGLTNLTYLDLRSNDISNIDNVILPASLTNFIITRNGLSQAPDLTDQFLANQSSFSYSIALNRLSFADLVGLNTLTSFGNQNHRYPLSITNELPAEGEVVTLSITSDNSANRFQWYRDTELLAGASSSTLELTNFSKEDEGGYYCLVTNDSVPGVEIRSEMYYLELDVLSKQFAASVTEVSSSARQNVGNANDILGLHNSFGDDGRAWRPSALDPDPSITVEFDSATSFNTLWMAINSNGGFSYGIEYSSDGSVFNGLNVGVSRTRGPASNLYRWDFENVTDTVKFIRVSLDSGQVASSNVSIDAIAFGTNNFEVNQPQELTLSQIVTPTIINISWGGTGFGEGVIIERSESPETGFSVIDTVFTVESLTPFSYSDRDAPDVDSVYYRVVAYSGSNLSEYSNTIEILRCPTVVATNNTWSGDADPNAFTGITSPQPNIEITEISSSTYEIQDITGGYMDFTEGFNLGYNPVRANIRFDCEGSISVDYLNEPGVSCGGDPNLVLDSAFYFPENDSLLFHFSWPTCGVSFKSWFNLNPGDKQPQLQQAPINLTVTQPNLTSIAVSWEDNSDDERSFIVERSIGNDSSFAFLDSTSAIVADPNINQLYIGEYFDDNSVSAGTTYYYRLIARNEAGDSPPSEIVSITPSSSLLFERLINDPATTDLSNATYSGYWGDYNSDGYPDLHVQNWQKGADPVFVSPANFFYTNNGDGTFSKTVNAFTIKETESRAGSWGDVDNDGDLDHVIKLTQNEINTLGQPLVLYENLGDGSFNEIILSYDFFTGGFDHVLINDYDNDGLLDILANNYIFYNQGQLAFERIDYREIFSEKSSTSSPNVHAIDIDLDNDLDIYFGGSDGIQLYINNNDRTFSLSAELTNSEITHQGGTWGDFDNDGDFDFFLTQENTPTPNSIRFFRNDSGVFETLGPADLGLDTLNLRRGATSFDYNNDGLLDILSYVSLDGNPVILQNEGNLTFTQIHDSSFTAINTFVSGVSVADIDLDGYQDFFIASGFQSNQSNYIYVNQGATNSSNTYLKVLLDGSRSNKNGIGARVMVVADGSPTQVKQVSTLNGTWSGNELTANFGLSTATRIDSIEVFWPSGQYTLVTDTSVNQLITISEYSVPEIITDTLYINENSLAGAIVDTIDVSDPDGDTLRYSITAGNENTVFSLDSLSGVLTLLDSAAMDFELNTSFTLTVAVSDPDSTVSGNITILVEDLNEIHTVSDTLFYVDQSAAQGKILGIISYLDPELDTLEYQITGGDPDSIFVFSDSLGALSLARSGVLNYDSTAEYSLTFTVSDTLYSVERTATIQVTSLRRDKRVLLAVEDSLNANLTNWEDSLDIDNSWQGVTIAEGRVANLDLSELGLEGVVPKVFQDLTGLQNVDLSGNNLSGFPNVSLLPVLDTLELTGNKLGFKDLLPNIGITQFGYLEQQPFFLQAGDTVPAGTDYLLEVKEPKYVDIENTYTWYQQAIDNEIFAELASLDSNYTIDSVDYFDMGTYYVAIKNSKLPGLQIQSDSFYLAAKDSIFGVVFADDQATPLTEGTVELFQIQPIGTPYDSVDQVPLGSSGEYVIPDVVLGDYILKIQPQGSFIETVIQTYYISTDDWRTADTLRLREKSSGLDIFALFNPGSSPGAGDPDATAFVEGLLQEEINEEAARTGRLEARRRVRKAGCSLRRRSRGGRSDQDYDASEFTELIAYTETDEEGNFGFSNLAPDVYLLNIQYPGVPMDEADNLFMEVLEGFRDTKFEVKALITEDGIQVTIERIVGLEQPYLTDMTLYPNPTEGQASITYNVERKIDQLSLQMMDMNGKVIENREVPHSLGRQSIDLDLSDQSVGNYILNIFDDTGKVYFVVKLIKK